MHNVRNQQDRQEEEWSVPTSIEQRGDNTVRQELQRAPTSPHSEDRLFTDWNSLDSPQARTLPRNASVRELEQDQNQPDNQTIQPGSEPAQIAVMGNVPSDNVTCQQLDQVGTRVIDIGTNTSDIEVRSQRDGVRLADSDNGDVQVSYPYVKVIPLTGTDKLIPVSHINPSTFRYDPEVTRSSHASIHDTGGQETIPQLDGLVSVQPRLRGRRLLEHARIEQDSVQRTTASHRR